MSWNDEPDYTPQGGGWAIAVTILIMAAWIGWHLFRLS